MQDLRHHEHSNEPCSIGRPSVRRRLAAVATIFTLAASFASPAGGTAKRSRVDAAGPAKELASTVASLGGQLSVSVVDLERGVRAVDLHEHVPRNPASNAKLATAAAALEVLGPAFTFSTGLYGAVENGEVKTLVVRGRGDPTLESTDLLEMARALARKGVTRIQRIEVDQSYFDDVFVPPAFEQQPNEWASFRAPVAAASVDGNVATIRVYATRSGEDARVVVEPRGMVDLESSIKTGRRRSAESLVCDPTPSADRIRIRCAGSVAEGASSTLYRRLHDPRRAVGFSLVDALRTVGIEAPDAVSLGGAGEKRLLVQHRSRGLGSLLGLLGKESNNFAAEMLLKTLGAEDKGQPTFAKGAESVEQVLRAARAWEGGFRVVNGSGLFDANRVTTFGVTELLESAEASSRIGPEFVEQLAIGGVDGTLRSRFEKWAKRRAIRAKSGTLASVVALSGYVMSGDGSRPLAFSVVVEGVSGKGQEARVAIDRFVDAMATELWQDVN